MLFLGREKDQHIVNSFESLRGENISMLGGDSLYNYFANNSRANIRKYDNIKDMLNDKNSDLIVLDREVYNYNKK